MSREPTAGPLVVPNTAAVRLLWMSGTRHFHNVLHASYTSPSVITPALPETIFSAVKAATSTTTFLSHLAPSTELSAVGIRDIGTAYHAEYMSSSGASLGTGTGTALSINNALVVTLRTAQTGQGFRGRVYLAGFTDAALANTLDWAATPGSDAVAFITGIQGALTAAQLTLALAQRALNAGTHHDGTPWAARAAQPVTVTSVSIANVRVDSQRKRLGR
jgi:hypothetical protein